jgi:hypothetical protein
MYVDPGGIWAVPSPTGLDCVWGFVVIDGCERASAYQCFIRVDVGGGHWIWGAGGGGFVGTATASAEAIKMSPRWRRRCWRQRMQSNMIGDDRIDGDCPELSSAVLSHLPGLGGILCLGRYALR